jgi:hypothetical protein
MKRMCGGLLVLIISGMIVASVGAAERVITVFDDNYTQGWKKTLDSSYSNDPNNVSFSQVQGIGTPPLGTGSAKVSIGMVSGTNYTEDAAMVRTNTLVGTKLADLTAFSFSAYQTHPNLPAYAYMWVDFENDGTNDDLMFYDTSLNGKVVNEWQTFDMMSSTSYWYLMFAGGGKTWAGYVAAYPNAVIGGAVNFAVGFGSGFQGDIYFDNVSIGTAASQDVTTYNFEIPVVEQVITVFDDSYTQGWKKTLDSSYSNDPNNVAFSQVQGIGTPPLGTGSAKVSIGMVSGTNYTEDAAMVRTNTLVGTKLADLATFSFSAYQTHPNLPAYAYMWVDFENDGTNDDLLFYDTSLNGKVANQWQTFDMMSSTSYWYLMFAGGGKTWAGYVAAYPNAVIGGAVNFTVGFGSGFQGDVYFDNVRIATLASQYVTAYDFEMPVVTHYPGDANGDNMVDVGDLGILAANYGGSGKTWAEGDFNNDGLVDVGDLGILAANYGYGTTPSAANFNADYAKVFGTSETEGESTDAESTVCSSLGLSLVAGLMLMGLMLVKLEE